MSIVMRNITAAVTLSVIPSGCRPTEAGSRQTVPKAASVEATSIDACHAQMQAFATRLAALEATTQGKPHPLKEAPGDVNTGPARAKAYRAELSQLRAEWRSYRRNIDGRLTQLERNLHGVRDSI